MIEEMDHPALIIVGIVMFIGGIFSLGGVWISYNNNYADTCYSSGGEMIRDYCKYGEELKEIKG